jgi:hypothetical protein
MATYKNPIVSTIEAGTLARKSEYRGNPQIIPIFIDASVALINSGDVIELTATLPQKCKAVSLHLNHNGSNGVAAATTLAVTAGGVVLTPDATIPTSADTNSTYLEYCLMNSDVSGKKIIATVGGADWADTVDMYGYVKIVTDE